MHAQEVEDYTAHLPATHKETATYSGLGPEIVPLHSCNRGPDFGDKVGLQMRESSCVHAAFLTRCPPLAHYSLKAFKRICPVQVG